MRREWRSILLGLMISALSLVVIFYFADLGESIEALRKADRRFLLGALGFSILWLVVRGFAWRSLLLGKATWRDVFITINEGILLNNLLPFRLGEIGRALLLGKKAKLDFWQVLSSILVERSLDLGFAGGLFLSTLPFVVGASWAREAVFGSVLLVVIGLSGLFWLTRHQAFIMRFLAGLRGRWVLFERIDPERIEAFFLGLAVLKDGKRFLQSVVWIALDWGIALAQYIVLLSAFFPQARLLWASFALGAAALGIAAPSSPGAVGVQELAIVGALSLFGLNPSTALAFALTTRLLNYLTTTFVGAYGLARDGESILGLYRKARNLRQQRSESDPAPVSKKN